MNPRLDARIVGLLAALMGAFMLLPLGLSLGLGEPWLPFAIAVAIAAALAAAGVMAGRGASRLLRPRDGFLVVTGGWVVASLISGVPYVASGAMGVADAWFEAVSGITTTGSTILADIEILPTSLLVWRAMTQWLGGMGIILFTIAVLPLLGVGGMQLFRAEVPGPAVDKMAPRLAVTARLLWYIYVGLTALELGLLWAGGMPFFEALQHAFTTMATGGFSPKNASIAAYDSPFIRWVIIVFMFLAGTNFVLHFRALQGRFREVRDDEEFRWYIALIVVFAVPFAVLLAVSGEDVYTAIEDAAFTTVALMTTTGYATANYEAWPQLLVGPIILLLVLGGMAGSTGGGIKTLRSLLSARSLKASFSRMLQPHVLRPVTYKGRAVPADVSEAVWGFLAAYVLLAVLGMLVVNSTGADLVTSWSSALTAIGNVGPGLGDVGPTDNFAGMPVRVKLVLPFLMLCGRLEIYTVLVVLLPGFWRR